MSIVARNAARPTRRSVILACQAVRERDFRQVGRRIVDLSARGMLVQADAPVLTGESIVVSFQTAFAKAWVDVEAVVMRVLHGRRSGDRGLRLGLHFEPLDALSRDRLERELGWFRPVAAEPRAAG